MASENKELCSLLHDQTVECRLHVLESILAQAPGQALFVSLVGPLQVGKSSFISLITGNEDIGTGYGYLDKTKGVWLFGPYSLNFLREKWGLARVENDATSVFFIDTEGFCGEAGKSFEENKFLICELVLPYLVISQVTMFFHKAKLQRGQSEVFAYFLNLAQRVYQGSCQAVDGGSELVDISIDIGRVYTNETDEDGNPTTIKYRPLEHPELFDVVERYLTRVQSQRLNRCQNPGTSGIKVKGFWPLPAFDASLSLFEQSENFMAGFKIVAQKLIEMLAKIGKEHNISGEGAFESFKVFHGNAKLENIEELAKKAREVGEFGTARKIIASLGATHIDEFRKKIQNHFERLELDLEKFPRTPPNSAVNCKEMIDDALKEIDAFPGITESIRQSELWKGHIASMSSDLDAIVSEAKKKFLTKLEEVQGTYVTVAVGLKWHEEYKVAKIQASMGSKEAKKIDVSRIMAITREEHYKLTAELDIPRQNADRMWRELQDGFDKDCDDLLMDIDRAISASKRRTREEILSGIKGFLEIAGALANLVLSVVAVVHTVNETRRQFE